MTRGILVLIGAFLIGCSTDVAQVPPASASEICETEEFDKMLWLPESALQSVDLPKNTRVIRPDMAVTMDYRPDRLNIFIGKTGRIERVYCG